MYCIPYNLYLGHLEFVTSSKINKHYFKYEQSFFKCYYLYLLCHIYVGVPCKKIVGMM